MVSEPTRIPSGSKIAGSSAPMAIGSMKISAAPKKEPISEPRDRR